MEREILGRLETEYNVDIGHERQLVDITLQSTEQGHCWETKVVVEEEKGFVVCRGMG